MDADSYIMLWPKGPPCHDCVISCALCRGSCTVAQAYKWQLFLKKGLTGWKKELEQTLKSAFDIQFILSILFLLKICTWKVSDVENVITKRFRIQFTAGRLKTRGSGPVPILSLQKTKVQEQSVQGIEFSIYLSHRSFGPTRPYDTWKSANKSCPQKLMAHFE